MWENVIALLALTLMEIVLGIDNIVFIAIVTSRLPMEQRPNARRVGLGLALVMRILLLLTLNFMLTKLVFSVFTLDSILPLSSLGIDAGSFENEHHWEEFNQISWRDIILFTGGLFLVWKSVHEIHKQMEGHADGHGEKAPASFSGVLVQIALLDVVFSLDSVITAVGMSESTGVMITAIIIAVGVMVLFANKIGDFVENHPTLKMLALSFLILIGVMLVAEGAGTHVNKNYIYFAMAFSLIVEFLNMRMRIVKNRTHIPENFV